jgi:hypothetical protein
MADKTRFVIPERPKHPLGWKCEDCFHVLRDNTPGSNQMICTRNPPTPQMTPMGAGQAIASIQAPVSVGQWCGEFTSLPKVEVPN